jgi:hypothetical protein
VFKFSMLREWHNGVHGEAERDCGGFERLGETGFEEGGYGGFDV